MMLQEEIDEAEWQDWDDKDREDPEEDKKQAEATIKEMGSMLGDCQDKGGKT